MYITSAEELKVALEERVRRRQEIHARLEAFFVRSYGIENGREMFETSINLSQHAKPVAILARQIASVCVEDVAFEVIASHLGLSPLTFTFVRDTFTIRNHEKMHRVKVPWIEWSKKRNLVIRYEMPAMLPYVALEGVPLANIECKGGSMLPAYHDGLRKEMGLSTLTADVSGLHAYMLRYATRKPSFVYRTIDGRTERYWLTADEEVMETDRPPASWYYPYYLSWFLDGSAVLFETYENPEGGVPEAKRLFEESVKRVVQGTGFGPLVVRIPPLTKDMLYCNRHLLIAGREGLSKITAETASLSLHDTTACMHVIAKKVIAFR